MRENKKKRTFVACLIELEADVKENAIVVSLASKNHNDYTYF